MMAHAKPVAAFIGAQDIFIGVPIPVVNAGRAAFIGFVIVEPIQPEGALGAFIQKTRPCVADTIYVSP